MSGIEPVILGLLYRTTRRHAETVGTRKALDYHIGIKLVTALGAVPLAIVAMVGTWFAEANDRIVDERAFVGVVAVAFTWLAIYLVNAVFLTSVQFDQHYVYFSAPYRHGRSVPWSAVTEAGYSVSTMLYYVRAGDLGRIWISPLQHGWAEFLTLAGQKIAESGGENPFRSLDQGPRGAEGG